MSGPETRDQIKKDAERRRNLHLDSTFQDLGEPIKDLLLALNKSVTNEEMQMLSKVSVRLLTKVFNMMSAQEDPDKVLAWLQEEAARNAKKPVDTELQRLAAKDPIAYYRELDKKNQEMLSSFANAEKQRDEERKANLEKRRMRREEAEKQAAKDRELALKNGDTTDALDRMKKEDVNDITNAFNRFTDKQSTFDNTNSAQDNEWWKKDEYRRDFEKNKKKGKLWTSVAEGGSQQIPDSEVAAREEWYKSYCWWKSDKYRRDWLASLDTEWWKEESYIREWQEKGMDGSAWLAADEDTGFNKKGHRRPAATAELARRTEWYKNNGPKGIVKMWCAMSEGSVDRCTLEEKRERHDYFKNGDWWKADTFVHKNQGNSASCDAIRFAGSAHEDREWWKDEEIRKDFCKKGNMWKLANEKAAVKGQNSCVATSAEVARREDWFKNNWWKADSLLEDYIANGEKGTKWRSSNEGDASKGPGEKVTFCNAADLRVRENWFKSASDRQWWKDPTILRDWEQNGAAGKRWTAGWENASMVTKEDMTENRASDAEIARRSAYFQKNWWKADKYTKDFQANGGKGTAWKARDNGGHEDKDWWKEGEIQKRWLAARANNVEPFWQSPNIIDDYWKNGATGKKWTANNVAAAGANIGDEVRASASDLAKREAFFQDNWWRTSDSQRDFAVNGKHGKLWKAKSPDGSGGEVSSAELRRRREFYNNLMKDSQPFNAMLESDAVERLTNSKFNKWDVLEKRQEHYMKNWWKTSPEARADWEANGTESTILKAASIEVAAVGLGGNPEFQASKDEIAARIAYFKGGDAAKESTTGDNWWKDEAFVKEWATDREVPFWKNSDMIQDYLDNGASGKKWKAISAAAASANKGGDAAFCAKSDELAAREKYFQKNFWKAPKYQTDFEKNGEKGTLWSMTKIGGKGDAATQNEMNARAAWYKPKSSWKLADAPTATEKGVSTNLAELLDRDEWFNDNWWKAPHVKEDYALNGSKSKLLCADNPDVITLGLQDDPKYGASKEEIKKRIQYFETCGDNEWWKSPAVVNDFNKCGKEGAVWKSRNFKESQMSMGIDNPAPEEELEERNKWYQSNYWKTPEVIADYQTNGSKGALWKAGRNGAQCPSGELPLRESWFKANYTVDPEEESRRKAWFQYQLADEEIAMRRNWLTNKAVESKRIHVDEIDDLLCQINDGHKPTQAQKDSILNAVKERRMELNNGDDKCEVGDEGITQEEFVHAVASTNFYIPTTDEERLRAEQETLDALKREEMERQDEVAGHMAMEAQEELDNAGFTDHAAVEEDDEAAFLGDMDDDGMANRVNEDDAEVDEDAWQEWVEGGGDEEEALTDEQLAAIEAEEAARAAAEAAEAEAEAALWENEEYGGGEEYEDEYDNPADLDEDAKEELEDVMQDDHDEWNEDEWEEEEDEEVDEMMEEEKGQPHQWKLPLPEVTNPQYLKAYFTVIKYTPSRNLLTGKQKRIWVIDHFTRSFYNLESNGSIKKEHTANKLLQLERNLIDTTRLRLMFFDAAHSYELQFFSARERERFYESASAIRPSIRVYAPDLINQDADVEACTTTIDGVGSNSVNVMCHDATGKSVKRELSGECQINASKMITEPITVWTGSFNLSGERPPKDKNELSKWMPKDKYDVYAIAVQEASYRREESEWFDYVQSYLGRDYLTLASMILWDSLLIVMTRKRHLLKITNVEGSTNATEHKTVCGKKGGIGISLRYLETSMIFLTCQLSARVERTAMRNTNLEEIIDNLQVGTRDTDFFNQFNHAFFFGDFNYRTDAEPSTADPLIAAKKYSELLAYDQFTKIRAKEGILHGFTEPPITFAPTYRMEIKSGKYIKEKGNASSYTDRVVSRSMANTFVKCTSYKSVPSITFSEHAPINATFIIRCVRPVMSCLMKIQKPHIGFQFTDITIEGYKGSPIKKPSIIIRSPFLATSKTYDSKNLKTITPSWGKTEIPLLETVSQVHEFLETSHIIFIIRESSEKKEKAHRGSGYIPMLGKIIDKANKEQAFECELINHGKLCGKLVGKYVHSPLPPSKV